ncbi:HTH-type transcriptional repressor GbsR [Paenibacillus cisolokensis]|uniref:HTH-type transcriptional regulator n=2 Tax=Paenibacillus TaxID=44249 RepID=A0ABQ4N4S9_9BACL|nr:GbsR/MarR family transcriptional regulator [Paenibacillus cisolokensis]GIQ62956.1 HTH-type transcriptional repressor GbsR [Paenibacillus cisolokensis]
MDLYGITLSIGHLYGNMYFNSAPVTLDEMSETMGLSKTSISTGMRTLMDLKMIDKVWGKGSRKDLYEASTDWYQNFADYFSIKWRKAVETNMHALNKSLCEMKELEQEGLEQGNDQLVTIVRRDIAKIGDALQYYRWLLRLIDALESGEIFKFIPKEENPQS